MRFHSPLSTPFLLLLASSALLVEVLGTPDVPCPSERRGGTPTRFRYEKKRSGIVSSSQVPNVSIGSSSTLSSSATSTTSIANTSAASRVLPSSESISFDSISPTSSSDSLTSSIFNSTSTLATSAPVASPSTVANGTGGGVNGASAQVIVVLQLAFLLETLEFEFYKRGLVKFGIKEFVEVGYSPEQAAITIEELHGVVKNEKAHVTIIEETILAFGAEPFKGCSLELEAALIDPITFVSTARTLEIVGIAAYSGAAHLIPDPQILTALATILSIESRHSALLNTLSGGTLAPQSFDIALDVSSVLALAVGFLQGCTPGDLGLVANEPLSIREAEFGSTFFTIGSRLVFAVSIEVDINVLFCQMIVGGSPAAIVFPATSCHVPEGIDGPVAVYLTNSSTPLASNILIQAISQIIAGPGIIFIDSRTTLLSSLFIPPSPFAGPLYSVDMGGYWIAKREGGDAWEQAKLVKYGSREHAGNSTLPAPNSPRTRRSANEGLGKPVRRSPSLPDSLLEDQGLYRRSEGWVSD